MEGKMKMDINDSEYKVMNVIWNNKGSVKASDIAGILLKEIGWSKNTTYTLITRLINKNAIKRIEPNYVCVAMLERGDIQRNQTKELMNKLYDGSIPMFFKAFVRKEDLSKEEIDELKKLIKDLE
jgi:predicted transcriptional regulator